MRHPPTWTVGRCSRRWKARLSTISRIEVFQVVTIGAQTYLIFCYDTPRLSGKLKGGRWATPGGQEPRGPPVPSILVGPSCSRRRRSMPVAWCRIAGQWNLMAFDNRIIDGDFAGAIIDPIRVVMDQVSGELSLLPRMAA